jgi:hypothetical protein
VGRVVRNVRNVPTNIHRKSACRYKAPEATEPWVAGVREAAGGGRSRTGWPPKGYDDGEGTGGSLPVVGLNPYRAAEGGGGAYLG